MPRRNQLRREQSTRRPRRCPVKKTGRYATEAAALFDLELIRKSTDRYNVPHRAYECDCGSWHLTGTLIPLPPLPRRHG